MMVLMRRDWQALVEAANSLGELVVAAPAGPQSGVSHTVTWEGAVRIEPRGANRFRPYMALLPIARGLHCSSLRRR